jgi:hypothetical protein
MAFTPPPPHTVEWASALQPTPSRPMVPSAEVSWAPHPEPGVEPQRRMVLRPLPAVARDPLVRCPAAGPRSPPPDRPDFRVAADLGHRVPAAGAHQARPPQDGRPGQTDPAPLQRGPMPEGAGTPRRCFTSSTASRQPWRGRRSLRVTAWSRSPLATSVARCLLRAWSTRYAPTGVHAQHLLEDPDVVIQGNRVLYLRYRVRR